MLARLLIAVALLLVLWLTRLPGLQAMPLHNDEGLHLTRAVEVWNLHPFWEIGDGKIINHWLIAAFYPQNAPDFVGRIATLFAAIIGMAAGLALASHYAGTLGAVCAGLLWITSTYLFFYERLAFSDAEAGALVVVTLWAALRTARTGLRRHAMLTGLVLALAALFKFTAAPYALMVAGVLLVFGFMPLRQRLINLVISGAVVAACFTVPLLYLGLRGGGFGIALGWISGAPGGAGISGNIDRLAQQLNGYGGPPWIFILGVGLVLFVVFGVHAGDRLHGLKLIVVAFIPFAVMMILGREVLPRHFVVALPAALVLAGTGWGHLSHMVNHPALARRAEWLAIAMLLMILLPVFVPFATTAYTDPGALLLPALERSQYVTDHSGGFGLREAVIDLPNTITQEYPIIGSMFPDGCKRANFYAVDGLSLLCTDAPGRDAVENALAEWGGVYILTDEAPRIGLDVTTLEAQVTRIAGYPRPGEAEGAESVVLWLVER